MTQNISRSLKIAMFAALASAVVHVYLTYHHYQFWFFGATNSLCVANSTFDCNAVDASPYSKFLGWFPLALMGALTNLVMAGLLAFSGWTQAKTQSRLRAAALVGATLILGASIVMATITTLFLDKICIFCLSTYFLSFVMWVGVWMGRPANLSFELSGLFQNLFSRAEGGVFALTITALATLPAAWLVDDMVKSYFAQGLNQLTSRALSEWEINPQQDFQISEALSYGAEPSKAKITLVEFADFQCGHCKHAAPVLHSFVASRPDVRLIFQSFPLDGACNPAITASRDGLSCDLAKAVLCAIPHGKALKIHDLIFDNFGKITAAKLPELAEQIGLNGEEFKKCLTSSEVHEKIMEQARRGKSAGVEGTPSIFVNGRLLPAAYALPVLEAAYNKIRAK